VRQPSRFGAVPSRGGLDAALSRPGPALFFALVVLVVAAAALHALVRAHEDRMQLATGTAAFLWYTGRVPEPRPLRFWATRDFELPRKPDRALAKVFVDRTHVLYVNGVLAGRGTRRPGDPLALYEVAPLLAAGRNRVALEAGSPTGIGAVLFSLDVEGFGRDALVTDGSWRVDLDPSALADGGRYRPIVWGKPPQYPWGYPRMPRPNELGSGLAFDIPPGK
jgi:hypothetical protein